MTYFSRILCYTWWL